MDGRYFQVIARIHTDFPTKFGIPRQSGLIPDLKAEIVFEPEYRNPDALRDGTPIYDIKPYLAFADSHPDALGGFTDQTRKYGLSVEIPEMLLERIQEKKRESLKAVLAHDPRPSYQDDPERVYGMEFAGYEIKFMVENGILRVTDIELR